MEIIRRIKNNIKTEQSKSKKIAKIAAISLGVAGIILLGLYLLLKIVLPILLIIIILGALSDSDDDFWFWMWLGK